MFWKSCLLILVLITNKKENIVMFSFMFAVLGSVIFWVVWVLISLIAGTVTLKAITTQTWRFVTTGYKSSYLLLPEVIVIVLVCYLFWPLVALGFGIYYFITFVSEHLFWKPFCKMVKLIDKPIKHISANEYLKNSRIM